MVKKAEATVKKAEATVLHAMVRLVVFLLGDCMVAEKDFLHGFLVFG